MRRIGAIAAEKKRARSAVVPFPWKVIPNSPQERAFESQADELFFGGGAGGGKAQACYALGWAFENLSQFTGDNLDDIIDLIPEEVRLMDSQVLMWNGVWKSFSELKIGDRIMNPDGEIQTILQIHERGRLDTYLVKFEDGTSVECSSDHLWGFWKARKNTRAKTSNGRREVLEVSSPADWNVNYITRAMVRDTQWMYEAVNSGIRLIVPIAAPLNYTNLHHGNAARAYVYGALIGDGHISSRRFSSGFTLTTADEWILERCTSLCEKWASYPKDGHFDVKLKDQWLDQWARNSGLLGKMSYEKFLPQGYLKESLEFRWNLAQGLFDTDGYASSKQRNEVSYCTTSSQLADDVANLVRSLGFMAKVRKKQGVCYSPGYEGEKRMSYIVSVEGNGRWRLFSLPRKVEAAKGHEPSIWVGKQIVGIEKKGSTYCRCITVSNPNSLYITDGYNVTHNSYLLIGLAFTAHRRSIIFRREYPQLREIIEKAGELVTPTIGRFNGQDHIWRLKDGRTVEAGAVQHEKDVSKYQGRAHDLRAFDEICHFSESQYRTLAGWNRTEVVGQRVRIVCTGNPPASYQGQWVRTYWGPWLDPQHPNPAKPGELVWYVEVNGKTREVGRGDRRPDLVEHDGELLTPRSRTFIPALVDDNPYYVRTGYKAILQSLPEPLRSQLLFGDFSAGSDDDSWQIFPTKWVDAAIARWTENPPPNTRQEGIGGDPSRGGADNSSVAERWDQWFNLHTKPGAEVRSGPMFVQFLIEHMKGDPWCGIDVIGIGSSPVDTMHQMGLQCEPLSGAESSDARDKSGKMGFSNKRAEWAWKFREMLDPDSGSRVALPNNTRMRSGLLAMRWHLSSWRIAVDSKDSIKERLGYSPDEAEAIIYASITPENAAWFGFGSGSSTTN